MLDFNIGFQFNPCSNICFIIIENIQWFISVFQKFGNYICAYLEAIYLDLQPTKILMIRRTAVVYFAITLHQKQLAWKFVNLEAVMREKVITPEMSANVILCEVITLEIYRVGTTS